MLYSEYVLCFLRSTGVSPPTSIADTAHQDRRAPGHGCAEPLAPRGIMHGAAGGQRRPMEGCCDQSAHVKGERKGGVEREGG